MSYDDYPESYKSNQPSLASQLVQALAILSLGFFLGLAFAAKYLLDKPDSF